MTNPPDLKGIDGAASVGGETVDGGGSAAFAKGMINVPFWDNRAALRVSAVEEGIPGLGRQSRKRGKRTRTTAISTACGDRCW